LSRVGKPVESNYIIAGERRYWLTVEDGSRISEEEADELQVLTLYPEAASWLLGTASGYLFT
jgi:hypothetical protein